MCSKKPAYVLQMKEQVHVEFNKFMQHFLIQCLVDMKCSLHKVDSDFIDYLNITLNVKEYQHLSSHSYFQQLQYGYIYFYYQYYVG